MKGRAHSAELIGLSSEAGVPTLERVAVPAHTRPKYQLASCSKRWAGLALACAEWTPIEVGDKSLTGQVLFQILFCKPLCTAKLPRSMFCWLLLLLLLISRDLANFISISRPSLRPHRAFRGLGDRHPITAGRLLGLDTASKMRQRPAAGLLTAQRLEYLQVTFTSPQGRNISLLRSARVAFRSIS